MLAQVARLAAPFPYQRTQRALPAAPTAAWWQRPGRHSTGLGRRRCQPAGAPPKVAVAASSGRVPSQRQAAGEPDEEPPHGLRRLIQLAVAVLLAPFLLLANLLLVDPPDDLPDGETDYLTIERNRNKTTRVKFVFYTVSILVVYGGVVYLATLQAPPRVEAVAGWITGGSHVAEVLTAFTALPLVRSPAMTLAAILLIFLHYKALFWFHYWHALTYPKPAFMRMPVPETAGPVMRLLDWLFTTPRGLAIWVMILTYARPFTQAGRLLRKLLTCFM